MFYFIFIFACFLSCIFHYRFQTKMCIVAWVIKQRQQYVLALFTQCLHCSTCFICCFIYIKLYLFIYMYMRVRLNWIKKDEEDQFPKFLFLSFSEKKKPYIYEEFDFYHDLRTLMRTQRLRSTLYQCHPRQKFALIFCNPNIFIFLFV